ncbi:MAG: glycosyltransferase [Paludibacteraceae bacterium]|nr:glycosyltransferase [Paludibacteraceae bacterium]
MGKRCLIITDAFTPPDYKPRIRALCDNLTLRGWTVEVCAETFGDLPFQRDYKTTTLQFYKGGKLDWFIKQVWSLLTDYKNRWFSRKIASLYKNENFDIVVCSTFSTFPLRAARDFARLKNIPFVADLRDIAEQVGGHQYQQSRSNFSLWLARLYDKINIRRRNKILREANVVTTVSKWHLAQLQHLNPNTVLIYNGYDERIFQPKNVKTDKFRLLYAGKLYGPELQDPTLLFEALRDLKKSNATPCLTMDWYVDKKHHDSLLATLNHYDIADLCQINDYVPITDIPALLQQCSIALIFSNKATAQGPHGVLTTKFFEILGVKKPALVVRSDQHSLSDLLKETNAGLAANDKISVIRFIKDNYAQWIKNGYTLQDNNNIGFSRSEQATQFENLFNSLLSTPILLTDICWTLFYSNTTMDFLDFVVKDKSYLHIRNLSKKPFVRYANLLIFKLFGVDLVRRKCVSYLRGFSRTELQNKADEFFVQYLSKRKIEKVWQLLEGREVVLVSATLDVVAQAVSKQLKAKDYCASKLKFVNDICTGEIEKDLLNSKNNVSYNFCIYDIVTDNLTDSKLVNRSRNATVVLYDNKSRWERVLKKEVNYIYADSNRY